MREAYVREEEKGEGRGADIGREKVVFGKGKRKGETRSTTLFSVFSLPIVTEERERVMGEP